MLVGSSAENDSAIRSWDNIIHALCPCVHLLFRIKVACHHNNVTEFQHTHMCNCSFDVWSFDNDRLASCGKYSFITDAAQESST